MFKKNPEALSGFSYQDEISLKEKALDFFLKKSGFLTTTRKIVPSPFPRHYRTTTKRKARFEKQRVSLSPGFGVESDSLLEPERHTEIFLYAETLLNDRKFLNISKNLNYVILRGSYDRFSMIMNLSKVDAKIVNLTALVSENITEKFPSIDSVHLFCDPIKSDYYLDFLSDADGLKMKRITGSRKITLKISGKIFQITPDCFSQVNLSIVPEFIEGIESLLSKSESKRLLDLYCGYGLFSYLIGDGYAETIGVDISGNSIKSAMENREFAKRRNHFFQGRIETKSLASIMNRFSETTEDIILDPPRKGTPAGLIDYISSRNPENVVHVFCNVDLVPIECLKWEKNKYAVTQIIPFDMFPGTPELEIAVLLKKDLSGKKKFK